jgi:hypothetical protein
LAGVLECGIDTDSDDFAVSSTPDSRGNPVVEIATQLKWAFIGLLTALLVTGWVISRFIPHQPRTSMPAVPHQSGSAAAQECQPRVDLVIDFGL